MTRPTTSAAGEVVQPTAARTLQEQVRDLLRAGNKRGAAELIARGFLSGNTLRALDADGRSIGADQLLLLVTLLGPRDPQRPRAIDRLSSLLNDYSTTTLPSAQRLFLMEELTAAGMANDAAFPTLAAERMATLFLERDRPVPGDVALRPTSMPDTWHISGPAGRVAALFTTAAVMDVMRPLLDEPSSANVRFAVIRPGGPSDEEAVAIGPSMPGWEISFAMTDVSAAAALGRRRSYFAIALLAIVAIGVAVAMLGRAARRQARLASLKTDLVSAVSHELKTPLASMRLLVDTLLEDDSRGGHGLDTVKTREYLNLMAAENARLSRLIENFLTFSRLERNRQRFTLEPTSPEGVVRETLAALPEGAAAMPRRGSRSRRACRRSWPTAMRW